MFGRKPKVPSQQMQELQNVKQQIVNPPAQSTIPIGRIDSTTPPVVVGQLPKKSPFIVMERIVQQRQKTIIAPQSGQVIPTGEIENYEVMNPVVELSYEDLIDIVAMCRGTQVGMKFRSLLEKGFT